MVEEAHAQQILRSITPSRYWIARYVPQISISKRNEEATQEQIEKGFGLSFLTPGLDLVEPRLDFLEPHFAESHLTATIPFDHGIFFVGLFDGANFPGWLSEVSQSLDSISWVQFLTCR
jgi:hypothetical protein